MRGFHAAVVPEVYEDGFANVVQAATPHANSMRSIPSKINVTLSADSGCSLAARKQTHHADEDNKIDDIYVRNVAVIYSTFARRSTGGCIDRGIEENFARAKYHQFRGAFGQTSLLMAVGALGLAFMSLLDPDALWVRVFILVGVVAPMYLAYGLLAIRFEERYLSMFGTWMEKQMVALLCLHSLAIVVAEWARPRLDYGMLVMHIGFVHNFTPLSAGAMHLIAAGFGLVPYSFLKWLVWVEPSVKLTNPSPTSTVTTSNIDAGHMCYVTQGDASLILEILVPVVSLLYQVVVTMRRDESMRLDFLSSEQLRSQRKQLAVEKQKCEDLLSSMLPRQIIGLLKANESIEPQLFDDVTVIFVEICHFSQLCTQLPPKVVVEVLNVVYLEFDRLSDLLHVYKVETVGQVYMAVVGCPEPIVNHADVAAHFALTAQQAMVRLRSRIADIKMQDDVPADQPQPNGEAMPQAMPQAMPPHSTTLPKEDCGIHALRANRSMGSMKLPTEVVIRVGLNSGRLRAGVVGLDSPRYKLVGDTVNTASRMESTCDPGRVQVSASTKERLTEGMFLLEDRGEIQVKGKGPMRTCYLNGWADEKFDEPRSVVIDLGPTPNMDLEDPESHHPKFRRSLSIISRNSENSNFSSDSLVGQDWSFVNAALRRDNYQEDFGRARSENPACNQPRRRFFNCERLQLLFLLVPASQKQPAWIATLKNDEHTFEMETIQKRIAVSRNLTIVWQLLLAFVAGIDYFLDVLAEDLPRYRKALIFRALGNNVVGLVYLLLLTSPTLFSNHAQTITLAMLAVQGFTLLACGMVIYNNEVAIISMYGAYVLFYTVCTFNQRLALCTLTVFGYVCAELLRCGWNGVVDAGMNISFLLIFFLSMGCGVRLDEHLAHVAHYEQRRVIRRLEVITQAKCAGSQLLISLLPPHVVKLVGEGISPIAEHHSEVSIIFTDIKGFTAYSSLISPHELVDFLNSMYSAFDEIIVNWQLHKVEIIGDAYFVSAGCPARSEEIDSKEYAMRAVEVALALQRTLPTVCDEASVQMRVGIHTGSVVAGVVGKKGPRYHLFGPAVGYAEQMESNGIAGRVQISDTTHKLLCDAGHEYVFEPRLIEIEGFDEPQRAWLVNKGTSKQAFQIQKKLLIQRRRSDEKTTMASTATGTSSPRRLRNGAPAVRRPHGR